MKRKSLIVALAAMMASLMPGVFALAQDFHKTYAIPSGGHISIKNISGDIRVAGYNIGSIEVVATKVGRDRDLVQVEDLSTGDRIDVRVKYPRSCNCDASVNFDVRVPAGVDYSFDRLDSVSGNVEVNGVRGRLHVESVSGNVTVAAVTGIVSASSVSGNVEAQIAGLEGTGEMKFTSVSGNVYVKAPANPNADIEMSSVSGSLDTDFPIEIQAAGHGPGHSARGRVGTGANKLGISSVSGKVSLTRS
jgi:DUF4097 and DUF4098 domain-containing protein YvlB